MANERREMVKFVTEVEVFRGTLALFSWFWHSFHFQLLFLSLLAQLWCLRYAFPFFCDNGTKGTTTITQPLEKVSSETQDVQTMSVDQ